MKKDHKAARFLLDNNTYIIFLALFLILLPDFGQVFFLSESAEYPSAAGGPDSGGLRDAHGHSHRGN